MHSAQLRLKTFSQFCEIHATKRSCEFFPLFYSIYSHWCSAAGEGRGSRFHPAPVRSSHASWCIAACMVSALNTSRRTSGSCPRFILASDCARPPVLTSWFLPHAGLHLATEHSQSQELERGTHCRPVSPPHHLCLHSGDS